MKSPLGRLIVWSILLALALLFPTRLLAAPETAQSPRQLVQHLLQSARQGDVGGFLSRLTADSRTRVAAYYEKRALLEQAEKQFHAALDEQFGKGTEMLAAPPDDLRGAIGRFTAAEVISENQRPDGSVELRVKTSLKDDKGKGKTREDTLIARQEEGAWKLSLGDPANPPMTHDRVEIAQRLIQEVRAGKYKDRFAAMLALANAWIDQEAHP